mmetsp:Transcript_58873/g.137545  ORF Transcript_58873/g.137545 Transcript_58873/m.137545 type:complete len:286 (+) Transcript_58873:68-925(+)
MPSTAILSSACACLYSQRDRRQNAIRKTCDASITPFQPPFRKFQPCPEGSRFCCWRHQVRQADELVKPLGCKQEDQECLLGMQSVLSLVKDYRLRAIDNFCCLLHSSCCWQAIHEDGIRLCQLQQLSIHLVWHEHCLSLLFLLLRYAIAHPTIAINNVNAGDGLLRSCAFGDLGTGLFLQHLALVPNCCFDLSHASQSEVKAHQRGQSHKVISNVVLQIAEVRHRPTNPRAFVLCHSLQVSKHLHWVTIVIQGIDDRYCGDLCQRSDSISAGHSRSDALAHSGQD